MSIGKATKNIPNLFKLFQTTECFNNHVKNAKILTVGDGKCTAELQVEQGHTNLLGMLNGSFATLLVDTFSLVAISDQVSGAAISIDLHMTFMKPAKLGDKLLIEANTLRTGKNIGFLDVFIRNKDTGDLVAKGAHTMKIWNADIFSQK